MTYETANTAYLKLFEHGCVVLRDVFPKLSIDALYAEFMSRHGALDAQQMEQRAAMPAPNRILKVGNARYEIAMRMNGVFGDPDVFANPILCKFLYPLLGEDMRLGGFTVVTAYPGAALQHPHRDHDHLFPTAGIPHNIPVYAVNIAVPLIDVDIEQGPTAVWPGSHQASSAVELKQEDAVAFSLRRGDCLLIDYRTMHAGMPNLTDRMRPILYLPYTRTWFFDEVNHFNRCALDMSRNEFHALPQELHPLLVRAYAQSVRADWHKVDDTFST